MTAIPIIAVFGSKGGLRLAEAIGHEVGRQNCILLTGGAGPVGKAVKNRALKGANSAANEGFLAPWIGVSKPGEHRPRPEHDVRRSHLLEPGLGDERNYVEAVLCDVAIAIAGGAGTASEVGFCLALERPVALVGDWSEVLPPARAEDAITYLADAIDKRIIDKAIKLNREIDPGLLKLIVDAKDKLTPGMIPKADAFPLNVDPARVVDRAKAAARPAIERIPAALAIPNFDWTPFQKWVTSITLKLAAG